MNSVFLPMAIILAMLVNCGVVVGGTSDCRGRRRMAVRMALVNILLSNCMNLMESIHMSSRPYRESVNVAIIWLDCYTLKRARETVDYGVCFFERKYD